MENKKNTTTAKEASLELLDSKGKIKGKILLDNTVFDGKISLALLQQAVSIYLSNKRAGQACAKNRGQKRGGGRKPWRQKGTGRARVGSIRSPLWRGGGITFAPQPHSYSRKFPERMKLLALKSALCAKLKDGQITLIDNLDIKSPKTKDFAGILSNLGVANERVCLVIADFNDNIKRASANFKKVYLKKASDINALEALDCKRLILTKDSFDIVQKRLKKWI